MKNNIVKVNFLFNNNLNNLRSHFKKDRKIEVNRELSDLKCDIVMNDSDNTCIFIFCFYLDSGNTFTFKSASFQRNILISYEEIECAIDIECILFKIEKAFICHVKRQFNDKNAKIIEVNNCDK